MSAPGRPWEGRQGPSPVSREPLERSDKVIQ